MGKSAVTAALHERAVSFVQCVVKDLAPACAGIDGPPQSAHNRWHPARLRESPSRVKCVNSLLTVPSRDGAFVPPWDVDIHV